jgi:predicted Rdx family selenoprotein
LIGFFTDGEWSERATILEESHKLRQLAVFFLYPEKPVAMDATACARCYFDRPSAPEQTSPEEEEEVAHILADAQALKKAAVDYLMPELPVKADLTLCGRNYFDRPSAEEQETFEETEERAHILEDAKQLQKLAVAFLHPEKPVETTDSFACGRNYFTRASAEDYEDAVDYAERELIMRDLKQLEQLAVDYLHPEKPVVASDPYATGRNYFSRPSVEEYESEDDMDERDAILEDMKQLKKLAQDYLQPELPVEVDPLASCRNYFSRASALNQESIEEEQERIQILADVCQLKKLAVDYLHPEKPVVTSDAFAFGRNYFSRPSAEADDEEDAKERELILEDMMQLKKLAQDYLQPERPVVTSDPYAMGRNYFSRPSADEYESEDDMDERDDIMEDMAQLKKLAQDYLQPERPVVTSDPYAMGRNYFSRASALDQEFIDEEQERTQILADARHLKQLAVDYLHPEKPVVTSDVFAFGRNYFSRPSADECESEDDMDERDGIMEDMKQLKKLAQDYLQPERPMEVDPLASCRNYFSRASALDQESIEEEEERAQIFADARQLKQLAVDYLHPEKSVITSDAFAFGRNYFTRASAEGVEDEDAEEREVILKEMQHLKQLAVDYLHPERPVVTSDPYAMGRNYFSRPSAEQYEDEDEMDERDSILEDMKQLKNLATDYLHPEAPIKMDASGVAMARNYFLRPSAPEQESLEEAEEKERILEDAKQLKKLAVDYLHPEVPMDKTSIAVGRNFFSRPSAPGHADQIHTQGEAIEPGYEAHAAYHNIPHHYSHHDDDVHSFYSQSDHFEMDEDMFHDFHESMAAMATPCQTKLIKEMDEEEEGNLSRSPSSVMLCFTEEAR